MIHRLMNPSQRNPWHRRRAGLTLMELVVVITIIVILVAGSLPVLIPALEQRRTREAARLVHTACGRAQSQAVANGRPAGVLIRRMKNGRGSVLIYQAEVPPPYAGDTIDAKVVLTSQSGSGGNVEVRASAVDPNDTFSFAPNMARVGDHMQFDYQGPLYEITGGAAGSPDPSGGPDFVTLPLTLTADIGQGEIPWSEPNRSPVAFQVFRQPIKTAAEPAQLPAGTVIDLVQSKEGNQSLRGLMSESKHPIILTFGPGGSLDRIYHSGGRQVKPQGAVYLLIGKLDKLGSGMTPNTNIEELTNLWVSIGRQTGLVTTSKMSKGDQGLKFARDSQSTGGL